MQCCQEKRARKDRTASDRRRTHPDLYQFTGYGEYSISAGVGDKGTCRPGADHPERNAELYKNVSAIIGSGNLTVDLGMVNRTDYYTGVIIKGYLEGYGEEVLSGGRYDKLIADFGYDVPATGFAVNVDAVTQVELKRRPLKAALADVIVFAEKGYEMEALKKSDDLRKSGKKVEISLFDSIDETVKYAEEKNISEILTVGGKEEQ